MEMQYKKASAGAFDPQTHYQNRNVAENYDRERFSSIAGRAFQWMERRVLFDALGYLSPGASVLDVPCGTGRISAELVRRGFHVNCMDISQEMIQVAQERLGVGKNYLPFNRGSADAFPFQDRVFDAVLSMRFLPHIATTQRRLMLREMARVSRHWIVFSNSYSSPWYSGRRVLKSWLGHQAPTRYPINDEDLQEELRFAGLKEIARYWTFRFVSEEILIVCEKTK